MTREERHREIERRIEGRRSPFTWAQTSEYVMRMRKAASDAKASPAPGDNEDIVRGLLSVHQRQQGTVAAAEAEAGSLREQMDQARSQVAGLMQRLQQQTMQMQQVQGQAQQAMQQAQMQVQQVQAQAEPQIAQAQATAQQAQGEVTQLKGEVVRQQGEQERIRQAVLEYKGRLLDVVGQDPVTLEAAQQAQMQQQQALQVQMQQQGQPQQEQGQPQEQGQGQEQGQPAQGRAMGELARAVAGQGERAGLRRAMAGQLMSQQTQQQGGVPVPPGSMAEQVLKQGQLEAVSRLANEEANELRRLQGGPKLAEDGSYQQRLREAARLLEDVSPRAVERTVEDVRDAGARVQEGLEGAGGDWLDEMLGRTRGVPTVWRTTPDRSVFRRLYEQTLGKVGEDISRPFAGSVKVAQPPGDPGWLARTVGPDLSDPRWQETGSMEDWLARNIQDPIGSFHTETLPGLPGKIWGAREQAARAIGGAAKDVFTGWDPASEREQAALQTPAYQLLMQGGEPQYTPRGPGLFSNLAQQLRAAAPSGPAATPAAPGVQPGQMERVLGRMGATGGSMFQRMGDVMQGAPEFWQQRERLSRSSAAPATTPAAPPAPTPAAARAPRGGAQPRRSPTPGRNEPPVASARSAPTASRAPAGRGGETLRETTARAPEPNRSDTTMFPETLPGATPPTGSAPGRAAASAPRGLERATEAAVEASRLPGEGPNTATERWLAEEARTARAPAAPAAAAAPAAPPGGPALRVSPFTAPTGGPRIINVAPGAVDITEAVAGMPAGEAVRAARSGSTVSTPTVAAAPKPGAPDALRGVSRQLAAEKGPAHVDPTTFARALGGSEAVVPTGRGPVPEELA